MEKNVQWINGIISMKKSWGTTPEFETYIFDL